MGRLSEQVVDLDLDEGVEVRYAEPAAAAAEVAALREPWIADEGPLTAELWRHPGVELPRPLHPRGLAFDQRTTVLWDEDAVQVIRPADPEPGVLARRSRVLIRDRFPGFASPTRVDYLRHGVLIASRYLPGESSDA